MQEDLLLQAFARLAILMAEKDCKEDAMRYNFDYGNKRYCVTVEIKDGEQTRNLTDDETAIYDSWIESEAKDTGDNIMDGEQK